MRSARAALALLLLLGASCSIVGTRQAPAWQSAEQMVVVTTSGWDATGGELRRFERDAGSTRWRQTGATTAVTVGRAGSAWGLGLHPLQEGPGPTKHEGDGRSPAGVFALGSAFGYAPAAATAMPYLAMQADDYCIDVPDSPLYNRIVSAAEVGTNAVEGSTEPMRRDLHADGDMRYRRGLVIEHNPNARPGAGSCIFAHLWNAPGEATAGCTAMAEPAMDEMFAWLVPSKHPVFVLLPRAEYARLQGAWALPDIIDASGPAVR
ncbi:L,D-transpeptidase family protein [Noviluteimonas gilva]|uniref:L,D-transpeptidase family protein n=1 Tax=Noviluteimonas gilva TaxID=2682097 RepID=UPI003CCD0C81